MHIHDAQVARAARPRRKHIGPRLERQYLRADDARGRAPEYEGHRCDDDRQAAIDQRNHDHHERQEGNGVEEVGDPHQDLIDDTAEITGDQPNIGADQADQNGGDETDQDGLLRAENKLAQHVLAVIGGAEQMLPRRSVETRETAVRAVIVRPGVHGDDGRCDGGQHDEEEEDAQPDSSIRVGGQDAHQFQRGASDPAPPSERPRSGGLVRRKWGGIEVCAAHAHSMTTRGSRTP